MFYDEAKIRVRGGSGGHGCVSFRREKFIPRGGPDGGDGGHGGSVYLVADRNVATLFELGRRYEYRAESGRPGMGKNRAGRKGRDLVVRVPVGTVVREAPEGGDPRQGRLLADLTRHGMRVCVARGGKGGRGNRAFATPTHQTPRTAEKGEPGEERVLYLELKLLADVGLVGLPNAGKSTLLSRISRAHPKIADYPFTTLEPHLGIVELPGYRRLVVADIPGLVEGAHRGVGLGLEFLRHIERTAVLIHLVSAESGDVEKLVEDYRTVERELGLYSGTLDSKPRLAVLSKLDTLPDERRRGIVEEFAGSIGCPAAGISAVTGEGVRELLEEADRMVREAREAPVGG